MKKLMAVLSLLAFTMGLTACNTMQGAGKDIERGGEKVQDAAGSTQKKM
jgi:predicted small secreted protein